MKLPDKFCPKTEGRVRETGSQAWQVILGLVANHPSQLPGPKRARPTTGSRFACSNILSTRPFFPSIETKRQRELCVRYSRPKSLPDPGWTTGWSRPAI